MIGVSHLEKLCIRELMAFVFLIEEAKGLDESLRLAESSPQFKERWLETERRFKSLIRYYPNEDEEKFYFVATLDAVYNIDPYSDETPALIEQYRPIIEILLS